MGLQSIASENRTDTFAGAPAYVLALTLLRKELVQDGSRVRIGFRRETQQSRAINGWVGRLLGVLAVHEIHDAPRILPSL